MIADNRKIDLVAQPGETFTFEISLAATQDAVRDALKSFLNELVSLGLTDEALSRVELVTAETLNNIVEHAFCNDQQPGFIRVRCAFRADGMHLRFTDFGAPMPDLKAPDRKSFDTETAIPNLPEGGFGWGLIRDLTEEISYRRSGPLNSLSMRININSI